MILNPNTKVENLNPFLGPLAESYQIDCVADTGEYEVTTVTCPATAEATQADYFYFENQAEADFAIWLDIDANGTAPTGAVYTGATNKIEVDIATGDDAAAVAGKVKAAIELNGNWADVTIVDNSDGTLTFTQDLLGATTDAEPHNADDTGAGSIAIEITNDGVDSNYQNTSFAINSAGDATTYYVWFDVDSQGTDPSGTGTGVEVDLTASMTNTQVATALAAALTALDDFYAQADRNQVFFNNAATGTATDIADVDSPLEFTTRKQGQAGSYYPAMSPADLDLTPSA